MASSKNRLTLLDRERKTLETEAKANPGKAPTPGLKRRLDALIASEAQEQRMLVDRNKEIDRINTKFDEDKARYEALTTGKFAR